jgi:peptidoglycan hydrolase-like protein with peptidoglycan-binding domain
MKKIIISLFIITCLPVMVGATTDTEALIESLRQQIETLRVQVLELQSQIRIAGGGQEGAKEIKEELKSTIRIARHLEIGARGKDVTLLQEMLASDPEIYPEGLVTGYFGPLTYGAVKNFQRKMGVEEVGVVGPKTMSKINELLTVGAGSSGQVPPGLLIAPGIQAKISYSYQPSGQNLPKGIAKKLQGVTSTEPVDDDVTSTPDIVAPVITDEVVTSTTATTVNITWTTDEEADSVVFYDMTSEFVISTSTLNTSSSVLTTSHNLLIDDLIASTTYYYLLTSADAEGNRATSTEGTFITLSE